MPAALTKASFAIFAGAYGLPAFAALCFAAVVMPMHLSKAPDALQLSLSLAAYVLACVSLLVGAWLCLGWLRRGATWLAAKSLWMKLLALFAPAYIAYQAWAALRLQLRVLGSADAAVLGQDYVDSQLAVYGAVMAWSLLFLVPLAILVLQGRKGEG